MMLSINARVRRAVKGDVVPDQVVFVALALAIPFAGASLRLARAVGGGAKRALASAYTLSVAMMALTALFCFQTVGTVGLFIGSWIASLVSIALLGGHTRRALLSANLAALCFMLACGLVFFGHMTLVGIVGSPEAQWFVEPGDQGMRALFLAVALVLASVFAIALARILHGAYPVSKSADEALKPLFVFAFAAIAYELLDAIPLTLGIWFDRMSFFLLGGTFLLTLFCAVFSYNTARTGAEAFREAEDMALERQRQDQEMRMRLYRRQVTVDQLTGLLSRRAGQLRLDELGKAEKPYIVAFIDLDGLKSVNDEHGHLAGDAYLAAFGEAIATALPKHDLVRWGGDEFLVIREGGKDEERELRERLDAIEAFADANGTSLPVSFSYGITAVSSFDETSDEVVRRADASMYEAKQERHRRELARTNAAPETGRRQS